MKYQPKQFCALTGLKSDTLRFYVDKGLIHPEVNENNNYKQYCEKDVIDYYYLKKCRELQIGLNDIETVFTRFCNFDQLKWISDYETSIRNQIKSLEARLESLEKMKRDLLKLSNLNEIIETKVEPGSIYNMDIALLDLIGEDTETNEKTAELVKEWSLIHKPLITFVSVPLKEMLNENISKFKVKAGIGFAIKDENDTKNLKEPSYLYKANNSIGMLIRLKDPMFITRKDLEVLFNYAKEHNYVFVDDLTSWLVSKSVEDGTEYYYYALRISVKAVETKC